MIKLNKNIADILDKHFKDNCDNQDMPVIMHMMIASILNEGINHFKDMFDKDAEELVAEAERKYHENKKDINGTTTISLIKPELFKNMLAAKREICSTCRPDEIENLIIYCNREYIIEESTNAKIYDALFSMIAETEKFSDSEIAERTGLDLHTFEKITGWAINI